MLGGATLVPYRPTSQSRQDFREAGITACNVRRIVARTGGTITLTLAFIASSLHAQSIRLAPAPLPATLTTLDFKIDNAPPLVVMPSGCVALYDTDAEQVACIDPQSGATKRFGHTGEGPGEFRGIFGFIAAPDGRLLVSSKGRITIISPAWKLDRIITPGRLVTQLVRVAGDTVFALGNDDSIYAIAMPTGSATARFGLPFADSMLFRGVQPYERGFWLVPRGDHDWAMAGAWRYTVLLTDRNGAQRGSITPATKPEYPSEGELAEMRRVMQQGNHGDIEPFMKRMAASPKPYLTTAPVQDAAGRLWVATGRIRQDSTEVDIWSATGTLLQTVRIGGAVKTMTIAHDMLYVIVKQLAGDAAGEIGVRRFRIPG